MDFSRLRTGEIIAAVGGVALLIFMFLDWYGIPGTPVPQVPDVGGLPGIEPPEQPETVGGSEFDAWQAFEFIDFVLLLTAVGGIALGGLAAFGVRLNVPVPRGVVTWILGELSALLIVWRIADPVNDADLKVGLFLGLAAAIAIATGAFLALREAGVRLYVDQSGSAAEPTTGSRRTTARTRTTARRSK